MINEDITKTERQELSIYKWRGNHAIGTMLLCPRFGKTKIGVEIAQRTLNAGNSKIIIITPSEYITNNWQKHFEDNKIRICSIDYYIKNLYQYHPTYDLVIVDEVHKFLSDVRYEAIKDLRTRAKWWLNLLGIMPPEKDRDMICALAPVIDEITTKEAIENGWVAPSIEYNIPLQLLEEDKTRYIRLSNSIKETLDLFNGVHKRVIINNREVFSTDFDLIYACYTGRKIPHGFIEGSEFRKITAEAMGWNKNLDLTTEYGQKRDKYWNPNAIYDCCKRFVSIVKNRNEIIINNDVKLNMITQIINAYPIPTIIFNESIEFVTKIADTLGKDAIAYHSQIESRPIWDNDNNDWFRYKTGQKAGEPKVFGKDAIKKETIEGIKQGKYKYLVTAKALDEGLDIPELEQVIITSGSTNPIQQGQRTARGNTINYNKPDKQTKIFNLYFEDIILTDGKVIKSRDKTKLLERQKSEALFITNLDEIS